VYVNATLETKPTTLQQWNVGLQHQLSSWLLTASYLGNHSSHLWRATELNYAVFTPGATTATTNARRVLVLRNPAYGAFYGTIGQLDDTGVSNYHGMLLSAQRRLKSGLSVLANYTLSKCMSDPATTELTGPTITDPNNPDLDYSACDSDRRHVVNTSVVWLSPSSSNGVDAVFGDRQVAPLIRVGERQPAQVTTGNALSGMGNSAPETSDNIYGDAGNYLNINAPPAGARTCAPEAERTTGRRAAERPGADEELPAAAHWLQFRWKCSTLTATSTTWTVLNSTNFGRIRREIRIMQFALKYDF
jgi:hypothetical protein